jgi:hypothetical protein
MKAMKMILGSLIGLLLGAVGLIGFLLLVINTLDWNKWIRKRSTCV